MPSFLRAFSALRTNPLAFFWLAGALCAPRSIRSRAVPKSRVMVVGIDWPWQTGAWRPLPRKTQRAESKPVTAS